MSNNQNLLFEVNYLDVIKRIDLFGREKGDRTGTGTSSIFGCHLRVDIRNGLVPLPTTRRVPFNSFIHETLWFLSGATDIGYLKQNNVGIWDSWVTPESAKFEFSEKLVSVNDQLTYLRCKAPELWKAWKQWEKQNLKEAANLADYIVWFNEIKSEEDIEVLIRAQHMKLVDGSIGTGAYGSLWRHWEDTRLVEQHRVEEYRKRGYQFLSHVTYGGMGKSVVTRTIDQIAQAIEQLKTNPDSRRIVVSAWNPGRLEDAVLPPCHSFFQFASYEKTPEEINEAFYRSGLDWQYAQAYKENMPADFENTNPQVIEFQKEFAKKNNIPTRWLSCSLTCRSQDALVGTVFNIAQYCMLTHMIAHVVGMDADVFVWNGNDVHIYNNQKTGMRKQLDRITEIKVGANPRVKFARQIDNIDDFKFEDITIEDYDAHPNIKYPIAV